MHVALPPAETEAHSITDVCIDPGNCQGQASSTAQSVFFFDESAETLGQFGSSMRAVLLAPLSCKQT